MTLRKNAVLVVVLRRTRLGFILLIVFSRKFDGSNTTFWVDFFRLQDTSHVWYRTSLCEDATDSLTFAANAVKAGDNCVAVHFSYNFENKFHWAVDCNKRLPFICVKTQIGKVHGY